MVTNATDKKEILKRVILANVFYLINKMGLKVGEVEEKIGVSTGYLSRLNKEDNSTKIGLDLVSALSSVLKIPMDILCNVDLTSLTPNESTAALFIGRLIQETVDSVRQWKRDKIKDLQMLDVYSDGQTTNPMFCGNMIEKWYESKFADKRGTIVAGDMYNTNIGGDNWVYITCVQYPGSNDVDYELYICELVEHGDGDYHWVQHPVCATDRGNVSPIDGALQKLYSTISELSRKVNLTDYAKTTIDNFLNPPAPEKLSTGFSAVDTDELPF